MKLGTRMDQAFPLLRCLFLTSTTKIDEQHDTFCRNVVVFKLNFFFHAVTVTMTNSGVNVAKDAVHFLVFDGRAGLRHRRNQFFYAADAYDIIFLQKSIISWTFPFCFRFYTFDLGDKIFVLLTGQKDIVDILFTDLFCQFLVKTRRHNQIFRHNSSLHTKHSTAINRLLTKGRKEKMFRVKCVRYNPILLHCVLIH